MQTNELLQTDELVFDGVFINLIMLILYAIPLILFIVLATRFFKYRKNVRQPFLLGLVMASYFAWIMTLLIRFLPLNEDGVYVLTFLPYVFSTLTFTFLLFYILQFYNQGVFYSRSIISSSQIIPVMTFALIIYGVITGFNEIRRGEIFVIATGLSERLNFVYGEYGSWHYLIHIYETLLVLVTAVIVFTQHFRLPKIYRDSSKHLISAVISLLIGLLLNIINMALGRTFMGVLIPIDFSLYGMMVSAQFFFHASLGNQGLVFLSQARNDIINCLNQSVLILDEEKNITYANAKATEWMKDFELERTSYLTLIDRLLESATQCERLDDESNGSDFYFDTEDGTKAYNLREKPIFDKKNHQIGTYVVYSDVTENRALIQRLEVGAGRDALTGLRNRGMMEHLKTELDKPESLPLSVIVCDLNDLKTTNDTYGHQQGDIMLRVAGEVIAELIPPVAQAGRMGGDEFLILLPQTTTDTAVQLSKQINEHLLKINEYPYKITLAMGVGSKTNISQELRDIIIEADEAMYRNKKEMKGSVRSRSSIA